MSKRDRHDGDRRGDRRDNQPEEEQQRRLGDAEMQESDSLTALKAILSKVAALLNPLQLTQDESIRLVEQLYGNVLETDVKLAGETDDTRKSSVLAQIQNATIAREGGKIVVHYPTDRETSSATRGGETAAASVEPVAPAPAAPAAPPAPATPPAPAAEGSPAVPLAGKPRAASSRAGSPRPAVSPSGASRPAKPRSDDAPATPSAGED